MTGTTPATGGIVPRRRVVRFAVELRRREGSGRRKDGELGDRQRTAGADPLHQPFAGSQLPLAVGTKVPVRWRDRVAKVARGREQHVEPVGQRRTVGNRFGSGLIGLDGQGVAKRVGSPGKDNSRGSTKFTRPAGPVGVPNWNRPAPSLRDRPAPSLRRPTDFAKKSSFGRFSREPSSESSALNDHLSGPRFLPIGQARTILRFPGQRVPFHLFLRSRTRSEWVSGG